MQEAKHYPCDLNSLAYRSTTKIQKSENFFRKKEIGLHDGAMESRHAKPETTKEKARNEQE